MRSRSSGHPRRGSALHLALAAALLSRGDALVAQTTTGKPIPTPAVAPGSVTGRVTCSDTNGPARFASVTLQPVVRPKPATRHNQPDSTEPHEVDQIVQTSLDGSFTLLHVPPGNYYIVADAPGYRTAASVLTREQMDHPTEAQARVIAQLLTPVSVASNRTSTAEVRLLRGATIAGTVRFDDGTPFAGAAVALWRKDDSGKWQPYREHMIFAGSTTNDIGQFRFSGLAAGEYRTSTRLELNTIFTDAVMGQPGGWSSNSTFSLDIYSPGTARAKEAQVLKLSESQSEDDVQIEVPLSKLHSLSGSLAEEGTGRRINDGKVTLLNADDNTELASATVSADDDAFHLAFVPEGTYTLKITNAQDVARTVTENPPGSFPPTQTDTKVIRSYGDASQPLIVTTELQGMIVSVPAAKASGTPSARTSTPSSTP